MKKFKKTAILIYTIFISAVCFFLAILYFINIRRTENFNDILRDNLVGYANSLTNISEYGENHILKAKAKGKYLVVNAIRCEDSSNFCEADILYESSNKVELYDDSNDYFKGSKYELPFVVLDEYESEDDLDYKGDFVFIDKGSKEEIKRISFSQLCGNECEYGSLPDLLKIQKREDGYDIWFSVSGPENVDIIYITDTQTWELARYCVGELPSENVQREDGKCKQNFNTLFQGLYIDYINRDIYYTDNPTFTSEDYIEGLIPQGEEVSIYRYSIDNDENSIILTNTVLEPSIQIYSLNDYEYSTRDDEGKVIILNEL